MPLERSTIFLQERVLRNSYGLPEMKMVSIRHWSIWKEILRGICFVNLVDYDMLYGHRNDVDGYAKALTYFDERLPEILEKNEG